MGVVRGVAQDVGVGRLVMPAIRDRLDTAAPGPDPVLDQVAAGKRGETFESASLVFDPIGRQLDEQVDVPGVDRNGDQPVLQLTGLVHDRFADALPRRLRQHDRGPDEACGVTVQPGMLPSRRWAAVIAAAVQAVRTAAEAAGVAGEPGAVGAEGKVEPAFTRKRHG